MTVDVGPDIRTAILAEPEITDVLSEYLNTPAVFAYEPVPEDVEYPMIIISDNIAYGNEDGLRQMRDVIMRDIRVYGRKAAPGTANDQTQRVKLAADLLREVFHRQPRVLVNADYHVISINATGPLPAPVDSDSLVGRVVTLVIRAEKT